MAKEYTIVDGVIFNGARDTEDGIWLRINNDEDHRILSSAVAKQIKNTEAAKGTLSALDPNAPHMVDYIIESLNRVLASVNGARPASAQLSGTPIGEAIASGDENGKGGKKRGRKRAASFGGVAPGTVERGGVEIQWAEEVPTPRPRVGDAFWTALGFANEVPQLMTAVVGFDDEHMHFVVESPQGRAFVIYNAAWQQWIGAGAQPSGPTTLTPDLASTALKELVSALRSGPSDLEDSQFESVAKVASDLLLVVAKANDRVGEIRSVAEYVGEYRTDAENAFELAGGIEYDLYQAVGTEAIAKGESIAQLGDEVKEAATAVRQKNAAGKRRRASARQQRAGKKRGR